MDIAVKIIGEMSPQEQGLKPWWSLAEESITMGPQKQDKYYNIVTDLEDPYSNKMNEKEVEINLNSIAFKCGSHIHSIITFDEQLIDPNWFASLETFTKEKYSIHFPENNIGAQNAI